MRLAVTNALQVWYLLVLNYKIEIGFEKLTDLGNFFTLDDATKGKLDNTTYVLGGGGFFYDVTEFFKSFEVSRGKSRELDRFNAGTATITFNNRGRQFDPTYTSSPFYGEIVPRRKVRISVDGLYVYVGIINDWNLTYSPSGESLASANAVDAFSVLSTLTLTSDLTTAQYSGDRVTAILNDPLVSWPIADRQIDTGSMFLGEDLIPEGTNALTYLQSVETSEPGAFFISKEGNVTFKGRNSSVGTSPILFADDGTGISYANLQVVYGSELLYNEVNATSAITSTTSTYADATSQSEYGILSLNQDGLLIDSDADLATYAQYLVNKFKDPEFRFEAITINLNSKSDAVQDSLLGLDIFDVIQVKFTPNGISPAIEQYGQIVKIDHSVTLDSHTMVLGLATIDSLGFILDSDTFGRLDVNKLAW